MNCRDLVASKGVGTSAFQHRTPCDACIATPQRHAASCGVVYAQAGLLFFGCFFFRSPIFFFYSLQPSVVGHVFDHTALVFDLFNILEGSGWSLGGQSNLRSCWRLPLHVDDVPCDLAHINAE